MIEAIRAHYKKMPVMLALDIIVVSVFFAFTTILFITPVPASAQASGTPTPLSGPMTWPTATVPVVDTSCGDGGVPANWGQITPDVQWLAMCAECIPVEGTGFPTAIVPTSTGVPTSTPVGPSAYVWTTYDDNNAIFVYDANWLIAPYWNAFYGGYEHYTRVIGSEVTFSITGTGIEIYGATASSHGSAEVFIDDLSYGTINYYSGGTVTKVKVFEATGLIDGVHNIVVRNLTTADSRLDYIKVQSAVYPPTPTATPSPRLSVVSQSYGSGWSSPYITYQPGSFTCVNLDDRNIECTGQGGFTDNNTFFDGLIRFDLDYESTVPGTIYYDWTINSGSCSHTAFIGIDESEFEGSYHIPEFATGLRLDVETDADSNTYNATAICTYDVTLQVSYDPINYATPTPIATSQPGESLCSSVLGQDYFLANSPWGLSGGDMLLYQECFTTPNINISVLQWIPAIGFTQAILDMLGFQTLDFVFPEFTFCLRATNYSLMLFNVPIPVDLFINVVIALAIIRFGLPQLISGVASSEVH